MLNSGDILLVAALGAAGTPLAMEQRFVAFKDQNGFRWATPTTNAVSAECNDGQTMVVHNVQEAAQSNDYRLSLVFCNQGDPSPDEIRYVEQQALADLKLNCAQAIADSAQRIQIMELLQR